MRNVFDAVMASARDSASFNNTTLRFGSVIAVNGASATVHLAGEDIPFVPVMRGVNPQVGDWAWMLHQGSLLVVIGVTDGSVAPVATPMVTPFRTDDHHKPSGDTWADESRSWDQLDPTNVWR